MPRIERFFANQKVPDWTGGTLGGGGGLGAFVATGGNSTGTDPSGPYAWHKFTSSGSFTVTGGEANIEVFVVGGGGGGTGDGPSPQSRACGGGGAGGYVERTHHVSVNGGASEDGVYTVTVGAGGSGGSAPTLGGYQGNPSKFDSVEAIGGGGGGRADKPAEGGPIGLYVAGGCGASTAGGRWPLTQQPSPVVKGFNNIDTTSPGLGSQGWGAGPRSYADGVENAGIGGGGGQGGLGGSGPSYLQPWTGWMRGNAGAGGNGRTNNWMGPSVTYGGGGGSVANGGSGNGGPGGGGNGGSSGTAGTANTGGGGGGRWYPMGQSGGSGIVIVRYPN